MSLKLNSTKPAPSPLSYQINSKSEICFCAQAHVNSRGLWVQYDDPQWWLKTSLPVLEFQLVLFFFLVSIIGFLLKGFGVSKLSVQIITGLIFGCSWRQWDFERYKLFTVQSQEILALLAYFGYMLFLFISAVKMDVRMILRTKRKALIIGLPTFFVPLICGLFIGTLFADGLGKAEIRKLPLIVAMHSTISFPVVASLLSELKIVNTELGRLGLSTALMGDLLTQLITTIGNQIRVHKKSASKGYLALAELLVQYILVCFAFRPAVLWIIKQAPEGKPVSRSRIQGVLFLVLLSAVLSTLMSQPAIFGPYVLGLAIPDRAPIGASLVQKFECLASEVFLPIFVITCGLHVDLSKLFIALGAAFTKLNIILAVVTFAVKVICCFVCSMYCELPLKHSLALSLILSCKGVVELSFFTLIMEFKHISDGVLAWFTVFVLLVATFVPIAVRCLYNPSRYVSYGKRNRDIMHLNSNSELRMLACAYRNENIFGILHLLNLSCPTVHNPLGVYVLHLIELIGRTTPIFISHRLKYEPLNDESYSKNIVLSFDHFERDNYGTVYVECFTAISPHKFMHNDICRLAFDKITSLILLPFHRTWTADGLIDQDDNMIKTLNCSVLKTAPCSVGIFADRGHLGSKMAAMPCTGAISKYSVCLIYLGGNDDREAIAYSKRLTKDSRVELTVLRLTSPTDDGSSNWEKMLDSEALRDFKMNCFGDERVRYIEEVCDDGPQTALSLRKFVNDYDLMIVGRRNGLESPQTAGLSEWNEFPELGVLGDLIVSIDINNRASVLVIIAQHKTDN